MSAKTAEQPPQLEQSERTRTQVEIIEQLARSFTKPTTTVEIDDMLRWQAGMTSDHANDQKATFALLKEERRRAWFLELGKRKMETKSLDERQELYRIEVNRVVHDSGGDDAWGLLAREDQDCRLASAMTIMLRDIGEWAYTAMAPDDPERRKVDVFVWSGCAMHKDLNAFKGFAQYAHETWEAIGEPGPVLLLNKDNHAAVRAEQDPTKPTTAAGKRAIENGTGGAIRTTNIAGMMLNNSQDSRGEGDAFRYWLEKKTGTLTTFPDVCNTRYISHGAACGFLLRYIAETREYVEKLVCYRKCQPGLNHMESNLQAALHDIPTLTEMAACSFYTEVISKPFMTLVRGDTRSMCDMEAFFVELKEKIAELYEKDDPFPTDEAYEKICFKGIVTKESKEILDSIRRQASELPHLQVIIKGGLYGALETWERFTQEFEDEVFCSLTPEEKAKFRNAIVNCQNEANLGATKQQLRRSPNMSEETRNSLLRIKHNGAVDFVHEFFGDDWKTYIFLLRAAQERASQGLEKMRRMGLATAMEEKAINNKIEHMRKEEERTRKANELKALIDSTPLKMQMVDLIGLLNSELDNQLAVWRDRDKLVPLKSHVNTKLKKLEALQAAIARCMAQNRMDVVDEVADVEQGGEAQEGIEIDDILPLEGLPEDEEDEGGEWGGSRMQIDV